MPRRPGHGPPLPYQPLAGVVPCPGGWLVVPGKLQGVSLFVDPPVVAATFVEVLDHRPAFDVVGVAVPIGLLADPAPGGRRADRDARALLGARRGAAVASAPARTALGAADGHLDGLSAVTRALLPRIAELDTAIEPYHQRTVFEVHPELSFHQLAGDEPLRWSKRTKEGVEERRALLERRLPSAGRALDGRGPTDLAHCLDAVAALWTARRIAGQAAVRIPDTPEWDDTGLRMEIVR